MNWTSGLDGKQRTEMKKVEDVYSILNKEYYKNTDSEKYRNLQLRNGKRFR